MTDPTALPSFPPPADDNNLRTTVVDSLNADGLLAEIDSDGDVTFKTQGQQLFVRCIEGDVTIMRVFGQWQLGEDVPDDELTQLRACNELNLRLSIVKTGLAGGTLVSTAEHLIRPGTDVRELLSMTTQVVLSAVQGWHQIVTGQATFEDGPANPQVEGDMPDDPFLDDEDDQGR